jgi:hypothetical protein
MLLAAPRSAYGLRSVGHHDLAGYGDAMQLLRHENALYVGHFGMSTMGTSILDVSDLSRPRLVSQWRAPAGMHNHKVQVADGLLLVNYELFPKGPTKPAADSPPFGMAVYRVDDPFGPEQVGFFECGGKGVHRIVYTGGQYAYVSATPQGFRDRMWMVVDLSDPARPVEAGRWWWPGQWEAGGEQPTWSGVRVAAHHALLDGSVAYLGYDDMNLVVLDVADVSKPTVLANLRWGGGSTHTCLPLPGRRLVVATDEQTRLEPGAPKRTIWLIDVADPANPVLLSEFPPLDRRFATDGARFGAHNLHENRPGSYRSEKVVVATQFSGGVRVYDIRDAHAPKEVAHWVPNASSGQPAAQTNDIFIDAQCRFYVSDRVGGGIDILEPEPELAALMRECAQ